MDENVLKIKKGGHHYGQSISLVFRDAIGAVQHTKACCAWETQISNCNKEDIGLSA